MSTWPQFDSSCDWGDCDELNVGYRNDTEDCGWLLVCQQHYDAEPNKENVGRFITETELQSLQSRLAQMGQERDEVIRLLSPDISLDLLDAARHLMFDHAVNKRSANKYQTENAALREENARLRQQVTTLDDDLKGTVNHCNEYHEDHYPETS